MLATARAHPEVPLWEAFAFPFHAQHRRLLANSSTDGAIGEVAEIESAFHFRLSNPANIRLSSELGGGALADVGCYPIRFASMSCSARPTGRSACSRAPRERSMSTRRRSSPTVRGAWR